VRYSISEGSFKEFLLLEKEELDRLQVDAVTERIELLIKAFAKKVFADPGNDIVTELQNQCSEELYNWLSAKLAATSNSFLVNGPKLLEYYRWFEIKEDKVTDHWHELLSGDSLINEDARGKSEWCKVVYFHSLPCLSYNDFTHITESINVVAFIADNEASTLSFPLRLPTQLNQEHFNSIANFRVSYLNVLAEFCDAFPEYQKVIFSSPSSVCPDKPLGAEPLHIEIAWGLREEDISSNPPGFQGDHALIANCFGKSFVIGTFNGVTAFDEKNYGE